MKRLEPKFRIGDKVVDNRTPKYDINGNPSSIFIMEIRDIEFCKDYFLYHYKNEDGLDCCFSNEEHYDLYKDEYYRDEGGYEIGIENFKREVLRQKLIFGNCYYETFESRDRRVCKLQDPLKMIQINDPLKKGVMVHKWIESKADELDSVEKVAEYKGIPIISTPFLKDNQYAFTDDIPFLGHVDYSIKKDEWVIYDGKSWVSSDKINKSKNNININITSSTPKGVITFDDLMTAKRLCDNNRWNEEYYSNFKTEVSEMELENMKKENLKEAKKQYDEEKKNEEIKVAKEKLSMAIDCINTFDRQIEELKERKKPYEEILKKFK